MSATVSKHLQSPKSITLALVQNLQGDGSFGDIMYELSFLEEVQQGLSDSEKGDTHSHDEVGEALRKWLS